MTKFSHIAVARERIELSTDNKHILSFKKVYDKLFREFKEKLVQEYAQMHISYTTEFEQNYISNL